MAETVVCLHGLGRSAADWAPARPALARFGEVVAPDLPGDPAKAFEIARYAVRPGAIVVGHSFGAVLALRLAAAERSVRGLVLTGSFFPPARNGRTLTSSVADYLHHRVEFVRAARSSSSGTARGGGRALRQLLRTAVRRTGFEAAASAVTAPVLVVHSRDDHYVPVAFAEAAVARHPGWDLAVLDAGGHFPHLHATATWARAVTNWIDHLQPFGV